MKKFVALFTTLLTTTLFMNNTAYAGRQGYDNNYKYVEPLKLAEESALRQMYQKEIFQSYFRYKNAIEHLNPDLVIANFVREFQEIDVNGQIKPLEKFYQSLVRTYPHVRTMNVNFQIQRIQFNNNTAIVETIATSNVGVIDSMYPAMTLPYIAVEQHKDTWIRTNSGWKLLTTQILQHKDSYNNSL